MKRIALYCRVSSDDQKDRDTIENQIETLETYIESKEDFEIYKNYLDDGVSGTVAFENRPGGKNLLTDASNRLFDAVIVWKVDRFGRDTLTGLSTIELLSKLNIEIISMCEPFDLNTPVGRFQFIQYLNMAELERNNILERMFIGATRAAKKGKWLGGVMPYGYDVDNNNYFIVNDEHANVVRKIFDMYTNDNKAIIDIAEYLNTIGIDSSYKARSIGEKSNRYKWSPSTINRILANKMYIGINEYGKRSTKRKETIIREVPAIIPTYVYDAATIKRSENKKVSRRNCKTDYMLRLKMKCEHCGRFYIGQGKNQYSYYICSGKTNQSKRITGIKCDNLNLNRESMEEIVWDFCKSVILNFSSFTMDYKADDSAALEIEILKKKLNDLDKERANLLKLFRKEIISEEELEEELRDINKEKGKIKKELAIKDSATQSIKGKEIALNSTKDLIKTYKDNIENLTYKDKCEITNILIKEIVVSKEGDSANLEIVWNFSDLTTALSSMKYTIRK